jgi:hypothetical protein
MLGCAVKQAFAAVTGVSNVVLAGTHDGIMTVQVAGSAETHSQSTSLDKGQPA